MQLKLEKVTDKLHGFSEVNLEHLCTAAEAAKIMKVNKGVTMQKKGLPNVEVHSIGAAITKFYDARVIKTRTKIKEMLDDRRDRELYDFLVSIGEIDAD